jgi:V-type H+-transporting ATPase subunit H
LQSRVDVLVAMCDDVRRHDLPWGEYAAGNLVTGTQRDLMMQLAGQSADAQSAFVARDRKAYAAVIGSVLTRVEATEVLQYVLLVFGELLEADREFAETLGASPDAFRGDQCHDTLLRLCTHEDPFVAARAMGVAASAFAFAAPSPAAPPAPAAARLVSTLREALRSAEHKHRVATHTAAARALQTVLRVPEYRTIFADGAEGRDALAMVASLLRAKDSSAQLLYHLLYSMWLLSFDADILPRLGPHLVPPACALVRRAAKEKVLRLALALLRNLLDSGSNNRDMIILGLLKALRLLAPRQWDDTDIAADVAHLVETLADDEHELSSLETYRKEVISGELEWSPVHRSVTFWRENISKFGDNNFQLPVLLVTLLTESHDPRTLAIACHDLGEFVLNHSSGREVAHRLKIKTRVMSFLQHEDPSVRKEALLAVQKMLVSKWELLA